MVFKGHWLLSIKTLRRIISKAAFISLITVFCGLVFADEYPNRPIRLIVAYPPGGSTDIAARVIAPALSLALGVNVFVETRAGANGSIGAEFVAKSPPDGYTILLNSISPMVVNPHTFAKGVPYDPINDFVAISGIGANPSMLAIHPSIPAKNLKELIEFGKTNDISLASSGEGGLPHLVIESLKKSSGTRIVHVPYKGGGPAASDAIAGHVTGVIIDSSALIPLVQSNRLRGIFVASDKRSEFLREIPTALEQGFPLYALSWMCIFAPAKTPKPVVDKIFAALIKTLAQPEIKLGLNKIGMTTFPSASSEEFSRFVKEEYMKWGVVAKESGARAND